MMKNSSSFSCANDSSIALVLCQMAPVGRAHRSVGFKFLGAGIHRFESWSHKMFFNVFEILTVRKYIMHCIPSLRSQTAASGI